MKKRVALYTTIGVLAVMLVIGTTLGGYALSVHFGVTGMKIRSDMKYQTVEGFGASSAWTYQALGLIENEEIKDEAIEKLYGDSGLALNIFRYNIGGGGAELSVYSDPLRGAESFFDADKFKGDYSVFANKDNYDFTRDKGARELFEKALSKGNIDEVVFFVNSPHYLMTRNGLTHGSKTKENNLKEECYVAFSDYLLVIVDWMYDNIICKYNKDIKIYISPVNEPQWDWGGYGISQEGCHYDPEVLAKFYDVFYTKLQEYNQRYGMSFEMDIFESGNYKLTESGTKMHAYMKALSKYDYFDEIDTLSAHSYGADTNVRVRNLMYSFLQRDYPGKNINVSEYCVLREGVDKSMDMGMYSAKVIMRDLSTLNAVKWNYWLSVSVYDYEDGIVYWNRKDDSLSVTKRYYAMGQFSKFIEPGSVRIGIEYGDSLGWNGIESVAFIKPDGRLALIIINDSPRNHKISLHGGYGNVTEIVTDEQRDWAVRDFEFDGYIDVPANCVATYIFTGENPFAGDNQGLLHK